MEIDKYREIHVLNDKPKTSQKEVAYLATSTLH